jgi:hypothetical protein
MNTVRPVKITSPISGVSCTPKVTERRFGDKIYTEARWDDPQSGAFIRKGIVKITDTKTGKDITGDCK